MTAVRILVVISLFLLASLLSSAAVSQEFYKWVDENGVVNFSMNPPPRDVSNVSSIVLDEPAQQQQDPDDDPFNVEATAERMQAYRDSMDKRRQAQRKERLERDRIAAQRPVVEYQRVGYRNSWPWYANRPVYPVQPIEPPPVAVPYPSVPFRPPGGFSD